MATRATREVLAQERHGGLPRKLAAECVGTFFLTFVDAGGSMIGRMAPDQVPAAARAGAAGLVVMAMIYTIGAVSGAHMNPAVTMAFALRGAFPWRRVLPYWAAEIGGAFLAAIALRGLLGDIDHLGMTVPGFGTWRALGMEIVITALLVSVILGTATHHSVVGRNAAIAVGGTVALCALFSRPISGASMNPARSLGPALAGGTFAESWIYIAGPLLGALAAVALARVLHGGEDASERRAAAGEE